MVNCFGCQVSCKSLVDVDECQTRIDSWRPLEDISQGVGTLCASINHTLYLSRLSASRPRGVGKQWPTVDGESSRPLRLQSVNKAGGLAGARQDRKLPGAEGVGVDFIKAHTSPTAKLDLRSIKYTFLCSIAFAFSVIYRFSNTHFTPRSFAFSGLIDRY